VLEVKVGNVRSNKPGTAGHESSWHVSVPREVGEET
jgi:hypothetical protein